MRRCSRLCNLFSLGGRFATNHTLGTPFNGLQRFKLLFNFWISCRKFEIFMCCRCIYKWRAVARLSRQIAATISCDLSRCSADAHGRTSHSHLTATVAAAGASPPRRLAALSPAPATGLINFLSTLRRTIDWHSEPFRIDDSDRLRT